jgi:AraC family transcriptional regulator
MNWPERMNTVIDYIEDNLDGEVDIEKAADIACCSTYHLQRIFLAVNGLSLAEYIRRRRLTLAAGEIMTGKTRIIDIALKYGYTSPDSFTRAFRNLHGVNPQAARESGVELVAFPRIRFHITLTGGMDMEYKIVEKPAFEIIARTERTISDKIVQGVIAQETWEKFWWDVWETFNREKRHEYFKEPTGGKPGQVTGAEFLGITTLSDNMRNFRSR